MTMYRRAVVTQCGGADEPMALHVPLPAPKPGQVLVRILDAGAWFTGGLLWEGTPDPHPWGRFTRFEMGVA